MEAAKRLPHNEQRSTQGVEERNKRVGKLMSQPSLTNLSLYVITNHRYQNFAHLHALLKLEDRTETSTTTRSDIWPGVATSELCRFPEGRRAMITLTQYSMYYAASERTAVCRRTNEAYMVPCEREEEDSVHNTMAANNL